MATSISWVDDDGAATLTNSKPTPGDRFANWNPRSVPFGDSEWDLGTADLDVFEYREDHSASFDLVGIPYNSLDLLLRLQNHLESGGTVSVTSGDTLGSTYPTCGLAPETEVTFELSDKTTLEYTLSVSLLNVATPRIAMVAVY
jgi:hypothetical protein